MRKYTFAAAALAVAAATGGLSLAWGQAKAPPTAGRLIDEAGQAMGGMDKVQGLKTMRLYGYGQNAYQDGGGNISSNPRAPQKWINIAGQVRTIDYEHGRMRLTQRLVQDFVFAYARNMDGSTRVNQGLDGAVAYNLGANNQGQRVGAMATRARRIDMLNNPVSLVRAAKQSGARLGKVTTVAGEQVFDLTTAQGDTVTVGVSLASHLPQWMRWVGPHGNFGDVTYTTYYVGYQPSDGLTLPSGYNTISNFRGVPQNKIYVDKYELNRPVEDIAAPAAVLAAAAPAEGARPTIQAIPVAPHIWYMKTGQGGGSTLFEFKDHLVMYEAYGSEANALATIAKIRETVPGKPLTQLIVSHHHIDHTGGLRAAVSEGLTVITNRGDNERYVREVTGRPATQFPDALQRRGRVGSVKVIPVDDIMVLKDDTLEVRVYRVTNNSHFAEGLFAYAPAAKVVAEGDLVDEGWDIVWWGNSYPDSVQARGIQVERDLPVHGNIHTYAEVIALLKKQTKNAEALCAKAEQASFSLQGCPVSNTMDKY